MQYASFSLNWRYFSPYFTHHQSYEYFSLFSSLSIPLDSLCVCVCVSPSSSLPVPTTTFSCQTSRHKHSVITLSKQFSTQTDTIQWWWLHSLSLFLFLFISNEGFKMYWLGQCVFARFRVLMVRNNYSLPANHPSWALALYSFHGGHSSCSGPQETVTYWTPGTCYWERIKAQWCC